MQQRYLKVAALLALPLFAIVPACGDDPPVVVEFDVDQNGGTVDLAGGVIRMVFPAGAVSGPTTITATQVSGPSDSRVLGGLVYDITPDGLTFAQPVQFILQIPRATLPAGVNAGAVSVGKVVNGAWTFLPITTDTTSDPTRVRVTASINSLSTYGALGGNVGPAGGTVSLAGGTVDIVVPSGALTEPQLLTATASSSHPSSARLVTGSAFELGPNGLTFGSPAQVTIDYNPSNIPSGIGSSTIRLWRVQNNVWTQIAGSTQGNNSVTGSVSGFSTFGALGDSTAGPPPGGDNEPAGFTLISERTFLAKVEQGWTDRGDANFTIETITGAPDGSTVGQALFPAGFVAGSAPILTERATPGGLHQLYLRFWIRFSANWVGQQAAINKIFFIFIHAQPSVFLNAQGAGSAPLVPVINTQAAPGLPPPASPNDRLNPNVVPGITLNRGQWHKWEVLLIANTPGQFNGTARWWIDGVLVGNHTNVGFSDVGESNVWELVRWNPTYGGGGGSVPANQTQQMDHVRISGLP